MFIFGKDQVPGSLNKQGVIQIVVFVGGVPQRILLDDIFAINKAGRLFFAEANPVSLNMWGVFLEKAWAKLNVNYERTSSGWQHEVVRVFTGVGAKDYICSQLSIDELWDVVYKNL